MEHRTQVGVECPLCHWRHFLEAELDDRLLNSTGIWEVKAQLEAWVASRCPEHIGPFLELSKN